MLLSRKIPSGFRPIRAQSDMGKWSGVLLVSAFLLAMIARMAD